MKKELIKLSNYLERIGLIKEADYVVEIMKYPAKIKHGSRIYKDIKDEIRENYRKKVDEQSFIADSERARDEAILPMDSHLRSSGFLAKTDDGSRQFLELSDSMMMDPYESKEFRENIYDRKINIDSYQEGIRESIYNPDLTSVIINMNKNTPNTKSFRDDSSHFFKEVLGMNLEFSKERPGPLAHFPSVGSKKLYNHQLFSDESPVIVEGSAEVDKSGYNKYTIRVRTTNYRTNFEIPFKHPFYAYSVHVSRNSQDKVETDIYFVNKLNKKYTNIARNNYMSSKSRDDKISKGKLASMIQEYDSLVQKYNTLPNATLNKSGVYVIVIRLNTIVSSVDSLLRGLISISKSYSDLHWSK